MITTMCAQRHRSQNWNGVAMSLNILPLKDILICLIQNKPEGWLHVNAPQTSISNNTLVSFMLLPLSAPCSLGVYLTLTLLQKSLG